jgi:hypothetical protein
MVANLRADNIDGYLGPDPFNQRAVFDGIGFIHLLTKELWDGHPCCAFTVSKEFATQNPNAYRALLKSIIDATAYASKQENRKEIAKAIAPTNYLNQPETVLEQILTGTYADGLGAVKKDPNRIDFDPFPWNQFAIWIMTQMKRWGQLKGDVDYAKVAADVYLATDTANMMKEMGLTPPDPARRPSWSWARPSIRQAKRIRRQLRDQAELRSVRRSRSRWGCARPLLSFLIFAAIVGLWQIAAQPPAASGPAVDPEYCQSWSAPRRRPGRSRRCRRPPTSASPSGST